MTTTTDQSFEELLEYVRSSRGFDFTGYKRPSLIRRVQRRMDAVGARSFDDYRTHLDGDQAEFADLFNTILINVTGFFRDSETWECVRGEVIPRVLEQRAGSPIRVWSAGCASGEEAYTAAVLLADALGDVDFRDRVKIYATDVDELALVEARTAFYSPRQLEELPEALRDRYFQPVDGGFMLASEIRRSVIFGRNDLLQDPPISRVDLLVCRNTLMYFEPSAQERVLSNLAFALTRHGFLVVGKAEALQSRSKLFQPFDLKRRVFVKSDAAEADGRLLRPPPRLVTRVEPAETALLGASFEHSPVAQVLVDAAGTISAINVAARALFDLRLSDVGRALRDLEFSYRPVELRSLIEEVERKRRPVSAKDVEWPGRAGAAARRLDVQLTPVTDSTGAHVGVSIAFADVTGHHALAGELEHARRELETAYEELQSTVEELETTNEELQSTNEELETTNEELQSTNEELETMNEELQSTNEELETMNDELRERTDEALSSNAFMSSILWSIEQAVVVVDHELRVSTWSRAARELWGLTQDEVEGDYFLNLDIGVPVGDLADPIRRVLAGGSQEPTTLIGHDRRGRPVRCKVIFSQLQSHLGDVQGAILVLEAERFEPDDKG